MGEGAPSPWAPVPPPAVLGTPAQEAPHRGLTCVGYQGKDTKGRRRTKTVCSSFPRASAGAKVNRVSPCRRGPPFLGNGQMGPGPLSLGPSDSPSTSSAVVKLLRQSRPGKRSGGRGISSLFEKHRKAPGKRPSVRDRARPDASVPVRCYFFSFLRPRPVLYKLLIHI